MNSEVVTARLQIAASQYQCPLLNAVGRVRDCYGESEEETKQEPSEPAKVHTAFSM